MQSIAQEYLQKAMTYQRYRSLVQTLFEQGKATGDNHSKSMLHYTKMGITRMNRLDKKLIILPEVKAIVTAISTPMTWLSITEGWCGDAGQILPAIEQMASLNPNIDHALILRDENLTLMDAFLTNGSRSIPKIIVVNKLDGKVLTSWGPRPKDAQALFLKNKQSVDEEADPEKKKVLKEIASTELQKWYATDKTRSSQLEFSAVLSRLL